jgi:hypothetical protein
MNTDGRKAGTAVEKALEAGDAIAALAAEVLGVVGNRWSSVR